MNTLIQDLNEFIVCRLLCVEEKCNIQENALAGKLKSTLNQEQADLFCHVLDFENNSCSILEMFAYKQGLIDGLSIIAQLGHFER